LPRISEARPQVIRLAPKTKIVLVYYSVLAVGLGLILVYMLWTMSSVAEPSLRPLLLLDCSLFVLATVAVAYARTRPKRMALTFISGILGGIQGYLDVTLYAGYLGGLVFLWIAFGVLLVLASVGWLNEP